MNNFRASILAILILLSLAFTTEAFAFPPMKSERLNQRLQSCLDKYSCTVTRDAGVCRSPEDRDGVGRSPTSCHLECKAIDIVSVRCSRTGTNNNHDNLVTLRACLTGILYTACYDGAGPCPDSHQDHLHFGARELLGCF